MLKIENLYFFSTIPLLNNLYNNRFKQQFNSNIVINQQNKQTMNLYYSTSENSYFYLHFVFQNIGYLLFTVPLQTKIMHRKLWILIGTITLFC